MPLTVQLTGTVTSSLLALSSENILVSTNTTAGVWELAVGTSGMLNADELILRAYVSVTSSQTVPTQIYYASYLHSQGDGATAGSSAQGEVVKYSPPISSPYAITFTLTQIAGTVRTYPWRAVTF